MSDFAVSGYSNTSTLIISGVESVKFAANVYNLPGIDEAELRSDRGKRAEWTIFVVEQLRGKKAELQRWRKSSNSA